MKYCFIPFLIFTFFISCSPQKKEKRKISQNSEVKGKTGGNPIESIPENKSQSNEKSFQAYILQIDQLRKQGKLKKYFYPNMSFCGGGLYGYYLGDELIYIDATYGADMGYSSKKIYWRNNSIIKIIYHERYAEWGKYQEKYPNHKNIDPSKMTYTDTTQIIEFDKKIRYQTLFKQKKSTSMIDSLSINRLIECGKTMKKELESEKTSR